MITGKIKMINIIVWYNEKKKKEEVTDGKGEWRRQDGKGMNMR
jgi:hypothetical protein